MTAGASAAAEPLTQATGSARQHWRGEWRTTRMSSLTRIALETLADPDAPAGLRSVACSTLLFAFETGIETPPGSHLAAWRFLAASDASAAVLHKHEIVHPEVARAAIDLLLNRNAGEQERDLALAVLRGGNVAEITQDDIVTIVDRVLDEGKARQVGWLVERVHDERGLSPEFIVAIRDRLAGSASPSVRAAAVEIGGLLPRLDDQFVAKVLNDPAPPVRSAGADILEKVERLDIDRALALAREHLSRETHRSVLSALHYCIGSLVQAHRKTEAWPIPEAEEN